MWFKNLKFYIIPDEFSGNVEDMNEGLMQFLAGPCPSSQASQLGWISPLGVDAEQLVHPQQDYRLLTACYEKRLLPSSVVIDAVRERVAKIEAAEQRIVSKREKTRLKDEIYFELLPKAFTQRKNIWIWMDLQARFLVIDTSNQNLAEDCIKLLHKSLPELKLQPCEVQTAPGLWLTNALLSPENLSAEFSLDFDCQMFSHDADTDKKTIRFSGEDLTSDQVRSHLETGYQVSQLGLEWKDKWRFSLQSDLTVTRIKYLEGLKSQVEAETGAETAAEHLDVDMMILSPEYRQFFADMLKALGGLLSADDEVQTENISAEATSE